MPWWVRCKWLVPCFDETLLKSNPRCVNGKILLQILMKSPTWLDTLHSNKVHLRLQFPMPVLIIFYPIIYRGNIVSIHGLLVSPSLMQWYNTAWHIDRSSCTGSGSITYIYLCYITSYPDHHPDYKWEKILVNCLHYFGSSHSHVVNRNASLENWELFLFQGYSF